MPEKDKDDRTAAKALALGMLGSAPATFGSGLLTRLFQGKHGKIMFAGPYVSEPEAERFPKKAWKSDPYYEFIKDVAPSSGKTVRVPVVIKGKKEVVPLPATAHEFAHAAGGPVQKITNFMRAALFGRPGGKIPGTNMLFRSPAISPLHVPLLLAAAAKKPEEDEKGISAFIRRHPTALATLLAAGPMIGEAHASGKALAAIKKIHGPKMALKSAPPLARAFAATASSYLPAIATIWGTSKIRDILTKKKEGEKTAGDMSTMTSDGSAMNPIHFGRLKEPEPVHTRKPRGAAERRAGLEDSK